jgi:hypothetical protein
MRAAVALFVAGTLSSAFAFQNGGSEDCRALKLMSRMARIAAWEHAKVVADEMQKVCAANDVKKTRSWSAPTKTSMKMSTTWYYPGNGGRAIDKYSLYYPADKQAKVGEAWYYPGNGGIARSRPSAKPRPTDRTWNRPRGTSETEQDLIEWACQQVGPEPCNRARADISAVSGDERVLAIIELAWSAHNAGQKK